LTEVLLLVGDVMLSSSDDSGILDTSNRLGHGMASSIRVNSEAFPVSSTSSVTTERATSRTEENVDTLLLELSSHQLASLIPESLAPRGTSADTGRESAVVVGEADAQRTVLKTETSHTETGDRSNVSYTTFILPTRETVSLGLK